jgi:alkylation response protein AidB-like acyl-CoA dehydrogenase
MGKDSALEAFRIECAHFISGAKESGAACPAYGAILPPVFHQDAMRWQRYCYDSGWAGIHWPSAHGGMGLSREHNIIWHEECAKAEVAPYLNIQGLVLAGEAIMRSGSPQQQEKFLRPTLKNEILWCQLFSEPEAGSDLAGLKSSAVLDGETFILNGQKVWSSNAQFAQFGILMARTDLHASKHKGISFFLLDMQLPGIEIRPLKQMTGDHEFCEVFFDDVVMPKNALLGALHDGWTVAMSVLEDERSGAGSADVISLGHRLRLMTANAKSTNFVERQSLTSLLTRGRSLQSLLELKGDDPLMAPIAKLLNAEIGYDEAQIESQLLGPISMLESEATERLLYSPGMRIAGGSSEIQRNIIGERILGLPREPKINKEPEVVDK